MERYVSRTPMAMLDSRVGAVVARPGATSRVHGHRDLQDVLARHTLEVLCRRVAAGVGREPMTSPSHPVLVRIAGSHVPAFRKARARHELRMLALTLMRDIDDENAETWALAYAAERAGVRAQEALSEDQQ